MMRKCEAVQVGVWLWGGMLERRDQKVPMEKERPGYHQHQEVTTESTPRCTPQLQTHGPSTQSAAAVCIAAKIIDAEV